jgi:hypothetical protein
LTAGEAPRTMPAMPRIDMLEEIRTLCSFPPRLACTDGERRAHEHVASVFRRLGLETAVEEFRFQPNGYAGFAAHSGLLALAGTVGLAAPAAGAALSALVNASFYGDLQGRFFWLRRLFPHGDSRNVVARVPAAGETRLHAVVMAHVDVAHEGPALFFEPSRAKLAVRFFRERFGISPNPAQIVFWSGVAQTALMTAAAAGAPTRSASAALAALHGFAGLEMGKAALSPAVPGASDNASGVAVLLALAEQLAEHRLDHTEVWLAATGCEEAMLGGAADLLRRHGPTLDRERTAFLAVDTLGAGKLRYVTEEGFVHRVPHDRALAETAAAVGAEDGAPEVRAQAMTFCTDALVPSTQGWRGLALIALDEDGYPPNYHWRTDVPEAIDPATPAAALDFTKRWLGRLDRGAPA